ncbi:hypothetical protein [Aliikangiella sp. G2MR2-5]|uniref:hypothetical protein n=1 Tax=Aliikangiella sp. G2MR2-5 TaxID=2788943 RepID=UPI0018AAF699|nr:hypothetical protein [Aliikangiella sp. G2MR2-5]
MKKVIKSLVASALVFSFTGITYAGSLNVSKSDNDFGISAKDLKNVPELSETSSFVSTSSATSMRCLVDTPAWDRWGSPRCFSAGMARYATAYFQITDAPSNYTVYWSDSRCSSTSLSCSLPIRTYQTINLSATVLNNSNSTFVKVSASAHYEGLD